MSIWNDLSLSLCYQHTCCGRIIHIGKGNRVVCDNANFPETDMFSIKDIFLVFFLFVERTIYSPMENLGELKIMYKNYLDKYCDEKTGFKFIIFI